MALYSKSYRWTNEQKVYFLIFCKLEINNLKKAMIDDIFIICFDPNIIYANFNLDNSKFPDIRQQKLCKSKTVPVHEFLFLSFSSFQTPQLQIFPITLETSETARVRSVNFTIHNFSSHSWPLSVKRLQGYLPPLLPSGQLRVGPHRCNNGRIL